MDSERRSYVKDEYPNSTNDDYSDLIGAVVSQQMIEEEKALEKKAFKEEKDMKEDIMRQQKAEHEEMCYKRLNLLLNRSSLYAEFMADKLKRDKEKENKKQFRAEKRKLKTDGKKKNVKSPTNSPQKKRSRMQNPKYGDTEYEDVENEDLSNVPDKIKSVQEGRPSLLTGGTLHPYQIEGYEWLRTTFENGANAILADEMGLGKTIQTIAFIAYLVEMGISGPFFVCGPLSTVPNWYAEFKKFAPSIPAIVYHGSKEERVAIRSKFMKGKKIGSLFSYPVILTSYQIALIDAGMLKQYQWKLLVIDEAHRIKNFQCKLVIALKSFDTIHRLLLTGTPLQNNLSELWSLLNFILPEIFDDLKVFESWFDITRITQDGGNDEIIAREKQKQIVSIIHQILAPFLLRRTKTEVNLNLPPKKEVIVHAPLTKLQQEYRNAVLNKTFESLLGLKKVDEELGKRKCTNTDFSKMYEMLDKNFDEVSDTEEEVSPSVSSEGDKVSFADVKLNIRNTTMLLRKVCNHPYLISYPLIPGTELYRIDEDLIRNSGKLLVLDQMLKELKKRGHKILLFSQFVTMLDILEDYCNYRGYEYSRLDGTMKLEDRQVQITDFNKSEDVFIFLISTKAGGLGLNLAAADTVIIYDSDWNPQTDLQAQDRAHRIGQDRPVIVYRMVIPNTIDEKIVQRADAKRKLEKVIIKKGRFNTGTHEKVMSKLTMEELLELLKSDQNVFVKTDDNEYLSEEELSKILDRSGMVEAE